MYPFKFALMSHMIFFVHHIFSHVCDLSRQSHATVSHLLNYHTFIVSCKIRAKETSFVPLRRLGEVWDLSFYGGEQRTSK